MTKVDLAALLALSSALCVAVGNVLQQRAARAVTDPSVDHVGLLARLLRDAAWRWGAVVLAASIALQVTALGLASVLLVQPLLMLSLLFAMPIGARMSGRVVTAREWKWAGLLTAAVIVIVTIGNPQPGHSAAPPQMWIAVAAVLGPLLLGCVLAAGAWGGAPAAVLLAFVSGSLWGVFAVLTEQVVHRLAAGGWEIGRTPELYAAALLVVGAIMFGQAAFRAGPLTASMPTLEVTQPVVAAGLGITVLGETLNAGPLGMTALVAAALVVPLAIWQLARADDAGNDSRLESVAAAGIPDVITDAGLVTVE
jgi:drug/metabolite transporter (DMT)-like permease